MINCPKCGTAVREEKAFCYNCGAPMDAAKAERETPLPDFGATVLVPPQRPATSPQSAQPAQPATPQPLAPPAVAEAHPAGRATDLVSSQPARVAFPPPQGAMPAARKKSSWKLGFILLVLFLMFLVFVIAILTD